jgi:hypothetical protein
MQYRTPPDLPDAFDNNFTVKLSVHLSSDLSETILLVAILDTGSTIDLISAEAARRTGLPWLDASKEEFHTLSGPIQELGRIDLRFSLGEEGAKCYTSVFHIFPSLPFDALLGYKAIRRAGIII